MKITEIELIGNYYGCLNIMTNKGKFYWCVENQDTDFENLDYWCEIPKKLYDSILTFYTLDQVTKVLSKEMPSN